MQKNYWLFKAEPHIYGIEHLNAAPKQIGRWALIGYCSICY